MDDYTENHAQELAARVLTGADLTLGWRDAGYRSALDAARVLVGDPLDATGERAAEIVAESLVEHGQ